MNAAEYVAGVRAFADWVEANEEHLQARHLENNHRILIYCSNREELAQWAARLGDDVEHSTDADNKWYTIVRTFGPIQAQVYATLEEVAERRVIGEKREDVLAWTLLPAPSLEEVPS